MKTVSLLLAVVAVATACGAEPNTSSAPPVAGADEVFGSTRLNAAAQTTYQRLQGKWQSTTDAKSVIEIKAHQYIDYYDSKKLGAAVFVLDRACPGTAGAGHPGDNEQYLVEPKEGMCWEIVGVDESGLELSYTARGNTLNYRRMN